MEATSGLLMTTPAITEYPASHSGLLAMASPVAAKRPRAGSAGHKGSCPLLSLPLYLPSQSQSEPTVNGTVLHRGRHRQRAARRGHHRLQPPAQPWLQPDASKCTSHPTVSTRRSIISRASKQAKQAAGKPQVAPITHRGAGSQPPPPLLLLWQRHGHLLSRNGASSCTSRQGRAQGASPCLLEHLQTPPGCDGVSCPGVQTAAGIKQTSRRDTCTGGANAETGASLDGATPDDDGSKGPEPLASRISMRGPVSDSTMSFPGHVCSGFVRSGVGADEARA